MKIAGFLLSLVAFLALRSFLQDRYRTVVTAATSGKPSSCIVMLGNTTREEQGSRYIVGTVRNDCDRKVGNVTIVFKVDGALDSRLDRRDSIYYSYERDVEPGETRKFKTLFQIGKDATYRFDQITAY